eukprot:364491-Chlamydomonas_euryale.AAC.14
MLLKRQGHGRGERTCGCIDAVADERHGAMYQRHSRALAPARVGGPGGSVAAVWLLCGGCVEAQRSTLLLRIGIGAWVARAAARACNAAPHPVRALTAAAAASSLRVSRAHHRCAGPPRGHSGPRC